MPKGANAQTTGQQVNQMYGCDRCGNLFQAEDMCLGNFSPFGTDGPALESYQLCINCKKLIVQMFVHHAGRLIFDENVRRLRNKK